jgi:hypothetical protein
MRAKWTFMVYMAGNHSPSGAASVDLAQLREVGSTPAVRIATFAKRRGGDATQRLVASRAEDDVLLTLPFGTDARSPRTLLDFARWATREAPAERHALVLWNHGGGWSADDIDQLCHQVHAGRQDRHDSNRLALGKLRRTVFTPSVASIVALDSAQARTSRSDDISGHALDTVEIGNVLTKLANELGHPLDLFGMEASLMSTLEVAYQVRKQTRAVVGSEELAPGMAWRYGALLAALNAEPAMDGRDLGAAVVATTTAAAADRPEAWPVTRAVVDTGRCEAFVATVDHLMKALRATLPAGWLELLRAQARAATFDFATTDLRSLCGLLVAASSAPAVRAAAQGVIDALAPGGYVVAEGHCGEKVAGCGGVSLYLPNPSGAPISPFYRELEIAKRHRWDELMQGYFRAVTA